MRYLTKANNRFEASIIRDRLAEAGISAQVQGFIEGGMSAGDVYVDERNLDNAREVLEVVQGVSEGELVELSAQSAHQAQSSDGGPDEKRAPMRRFREWILKR